ncbi:MAG: hypothetical protein QM569_13830 [Acidovorax sp.]|uniref:hypothetical protein n=1 Tax=Acidovorax sp. TaxID=1872122 RepID=UPI0039E55011
MSRFLLTLTGIGLICAAVAFRAPTWVYFLAGIPLYMSSYPHEKKWKPGGVIALVLLLAVGAVVLGTLGMLLRSVFIR